MRKSSVFVNTILAVVLALGVVLAAAPGEVRAATITVCPSGCDQTTIQAAIDAAASGDTITVGPGTYDGTIDIVSKNNISIVGVDPATTIVKSSTTLGWNIGGYTTNRQTVLRVISSTGISISGLTFDMDLVKGNNIFAGLLWDSTGVIDGNVFKNNQVPDGSGGYYELGLALRTSTYTDGARAAVTVSDNTFQDMGRVALLVHNFVNATVTGNTFSKTVDDFGYGIELGSQSTGTISFNTFTGFDTAALSDGSNSAAIYVENCFTDTQLTAVTKNVTLANNVVSGNQWGVYIGNEFDGMAGNVDIVLNMTYNNIHNNIDGGVYIVDEDMADGSSVTVTGSGNTITNNGGYGYYISTQGDGDVSVSLSNDTVSGHDTGVYVEDLGGLSSTSAYDVTFFGSKFTNNTPYQINNDVAPLTVTADTNWWGSVSGPEMVTLDGLITYEPWCGDVDCMYSVNTNTDGEIILPSVLTEAEIQTAINSARTGTKLLLPAGTYNISGGFTIPNPGVTIILADGVVIQNNSPCFTVEADNTIITAETFGGAKCVPTDSSNGIDVAAGLTNIVIDGVEIDGTGQTTGDGINFAGAVTDVLIANTFIHDLDGDGVYFGAQPAGVIDIRGNLFKSNGGLGINNPNGTSDIDATYNSWGEYLGPKVGDGDGVSLHVAYDPWTYAEIFFMSSGSPWPDYVVKGQNVTYTVYGKLENSTGADFTLNIPAGLTVESYAAGDVFDVSTVTPGTGTLHFVGYQEGGPGAATPVSGVDLALFTVTLSSTTTTGYTLTIDDTSDLFSMTPTSGSSNNVYPTVLNTGMVVVVDLPTIGSTDIEGYYLTTEARDFHVTVTNTNGRYYNSSIYYDFTIDGAVSDDITSLTCDITGTTLPVSFTQNTGYLSARVGGITMDAGGDTFTCTAIFATAKSYPITIDVVDSGATPAYMDLATMSKTAVVHAKPVITSSDMDGPYLVGIPQDFTLTITNGSTIPAGPFVVTLNFPAGTVVHFGATDYPCTGGLCSIPVTPTTGVNNLTFTVTFAAATSGSYTATLFDTVWDPDRTLAAYTQTGLIAYANYTVTGTFSMQGRVTRAGIPVTITKTTVPYGPYSTTTSALLSLNFSFLNVPVDTWTVTTNQPRYLDVTKTFTFIADKVLNALELKGGDADDDNAINVTDASIIGAQYGSLTPTNGDINFDGKVNIFDLALVGGNFGLDSATAYDTWTP